MPGSHLRQLEPLGLAPGPASSLERYLDLLSAWSLRTNLTGARTPGERVRVLVAPVLPAAPLVVGRLLDVGSGNGSPGLVLAALRPDVPVVLLEPRQRRWAFLREAARAIGRPDIAVLRQRHDAYGGPPAGTLTLRAVAIPLEELAALLEPGGRVLAFGTAPPPASGWVAEPSPRPGALHVLCRRECFTGNNHNKGI